MEHAVQIGFDIEVVSALSIPVTFEPPSLIHLAIRVLKDTEAVFLAVLPLARVTVPILRRDR